MKTQNQNIKFVVLIKACRTKFQVYVYSNEPDLLIRTSGIELENSQKASNIMGVFTFFKHKSPNKHSFSECNKLL